MQRYLTPGDYSIQIRQEIKTLLTGSNDNKLIIAEHAAVGQMKSYLKKRYNIAQIFFLLQGEFSASRAYVAGDLVYHKETSEAVEEYKVYSANANLSAGEWSASNWTLHTGRNPFVLLYLVDLTLYHLMSKDASRLIPQVRLDRYEDALDWLKAVGNGQLDADLPQLVESDEGYKPEIRYNSHTVENQRW